MKLYFGGTEIPSHATTLREAGVTDVYLSYIGLRRRVKFSKPWLIAEKLPGMSVLLDSGAYTVNQEEEQDLDELAEIATGYMAFVQANLEAVEAFTEFDALPLGLDWIRGVRDDFYDDLGSKFVPVWHPSYGIDELERLAARYSRLAVSSTSTRDRDLIPALNKLVDSRGTKLYGLGLTKPDTMRAVRWEGVGSTSWLSPMKFGETQVWTGRELKWYPVKYKEQARKRHRTLFTSNGFDAAKIAADDAHEVTRVALWSWQKLVDDINRRKRVTQAPEPATEPDAEILDLPVTHEPDSGLNEELVAERPVRERQTLPVVGLTETEGQIPELHARSESLRKCDTCYLRERGCPGYQPGADCLYEIPVEVKTPDQVRALENTLIKIQTDRVMFMKMAEDLEGGFPDSNLSNEMDRLTKMIRNQREGNLAKFNLNISASQPIEGGGILSSLGWEKAAEAQQIEAPHPADELMKHIIDGEVINDKQPEDRK